MYDSIIEMENRLGSVCQELRIGRRKRRKSGKKIVIAIKGNTRNLCGNGNAMCQNCGGKYTNLHM